MSRISLSGPITSQPRSWSIKGSVNRGWTANLDFAGLLDLRATKSTPQSIAITGENDPSNPLTLTDFFYVGQRSRSWGIKSSAKSTSYELNDIPSIKLSSGGQSFDTFSDVTFADVVSAIATRAGVTISGASTSPIFVEDIKQSTLWAPLQRMAAADGMDLIVDTDGSVKFISMTPSGTCTMPPWLISETFNPWSQYDSILTQKRTGQGVNQGIQYYRETTTGNKESELQWPISSASVSDESTSGSIGWVRLWDGPPSGSGQLIWANQLGGVTGDVILPPLDGSWPATHVSFLVYPNTASPSTPINAVLAINGVSPITIPAGIDPSFSVILTQGAGTDRGFPRIYNESLIPSEAHAIAHKAAYFQSINRGTDMITVTGPLTTTARFGQTWSYAGLSGRIIDIEHRGGANSMAFTVLGCEVV